MKIFDRPHHLNDSDNNGTDKPGVDSTPKERNLTLRTVRDSSGAMLSPKLSGGSPPPSSAPQPSATSTVVADGASCLCIRRARHAEVLLADSLVMSHGRTWLRLRWPGAQGGFGGFVALDKADVDELNEKGMKTGVVAEYPSGKAMKLLEEYDDGLGEGKEEGESGEVSLVCIWRF